MRHDALRAQWWRVVRFYMSALTRIHLRDLFHGHIRGLRVGHAWAVRLQQDGPAALRPVPAEDALSADAW